MDDGQTFAHEKHCEKAYTRFFFSGETNMLSLQNQLDEHCHYDGAKNQVISQVTIYTVEKAPSMVINKLTQKNAEFSYDEEKMSVTVKNLDFRAAIET